MDIMKIFALKRKLEGQKDKDTIKDVKEKLEKSKREVKNNE